MRKTVVISILMALLISMNGCFTMNHIVGDGAKQGQVEKERQWYVLWGLVPLNKVDSKAMAAGATSYQIKTELTFIDFLMNIATGFVTVYSRTIEVQR